jgi:nucleotide-binding universal stress UspA family protein
MQAGGPAKGAVVVGVDGSTGSIRALTWAGEEARLRKARLKALLAWEYPLVMYADVDPPPPEETVSEVHRQAEERLAQAVAEAGPALDDVEVEESVVEGAAASVLIEAGQAADLIVVGTRGHGGFTGLLLGSVSQQVAHHAPCPVVIVPPERDGKE